MPVIRGNDVVTINGARIAKQGMAHIKPGMTVEAAADKTKNNGMDEMIIGFMGADGKAERMIIYGDNLDFSFRKSKNEPDIRINGEPGILLAFDDEQVGFGERFGAGLRNGFREAADTIGMLAKKTIDNLPLFVGGTALGGTLLFTFAKGAAVEAVKNAIIYLPKLPIIAGGALAVGAGVIIVSALIKALTGGQTHNSASIAAVIDDNPEKGIAGAANVKPTPQPQAPLPARPPVIGAQPAANAPAVRPVNLRPLTGGNP